MGKISTGAAMGPLPSVYDVFSEFHNALLSLNSGVSAFAMPSVTCIVNVLDLRRCAALTDGNADEL